MQVAQFGISLHYVQQPYYAELRENDTWGEVEIKSPFISAGQTLCDIASSATRAPEFITLRTQILCWKEIESIIARQAVTSIDASRAIPWTANAKIHTLRIDSFHEFSETSLMGARAVARILSKSSIRRRGIGVVRQWRTACTSVTLFNFSITTWYLTYVDYLRKFYSTLILITLLPDFFSILITEYLVQDPLQLSQVLISLSSGSLRLD
jgi:hypothetical protein